MRLSLSFLAIDRQQLPKKGNYGNNCIEAVSFNRSDLNSSNWRTIWRNIEVATKEYGSENVTYHFPMNDCCYIEDDYVFGRLEEAYHRARDLGLAGMVVHSNSWKPIKHWQVLDLNVARRQVLDRLGMLSKQVNTQTWLGLENMPIIGNTGYDIDPLFCFAHDFQHLPPALSVVWDICHANANLAYLQADRNDLLTRSAPAEECNFEAIAHKIRHWHFAAYRGLNNPTERTACIEGLLPREGDSTESVYANALVRICKISSRNSIINFEVQEDDYKLRKRGPEIISWASSLIGV